MKAIDKLNEMMHRDDCEFVLYSSQLDEIFVFDWKCRYIYMGVMKILNEDAMYIPVIRDSGMIVVSARLFKKLEYLGEL